MAEPYEEKPIGPVKGYEPFDLSKCDIGIQPLVAYLRAHGYPTISSCSGHGKDVPWVLITGHVDVERLADAMHNGGYDDVRIDLRNRFSQQERVKHTSTYLSFFAAQTSDWSDILAVKPPHPRSPDAYA